MIIEHQVWAIPPDGRISECQEVYSIDRWQWALKLKRLLTERGFRQVVIYDTEAFEETEPEGSELETC